MSLSPTPTAAPGITKRALYRAAVGFLALCGIYVWLAWGAISRKSVTIDEFVNLPVGYNVLTTGDFRYAVYHPPLLNLLWALPLERGQDSPRLIDGAANSAEKYDSWVNGYTFMSGFASSYHALFMRARCVSLLLTVCLGAVLVGWAMTILPGERGVFAGLLACAMLWFSPNFLAHAALVSSDIGAAVFMTPAVLALYLFVRRESWGTAALLGFCFGLAVLAKGTALLLLPVMPFMMWIGRRFYADESPEIDRRDTAAPRSNRTSETVALLGKLAAAALLTIVVLNCGYLFHESFRSARDLRFETGWLNSALNALPGWTPIPLPAGFLRALDTQASEAQSGYAAYLFGQSSHSGFWYYFVALIAMKAALPSIALFAAAMLISIKKRAFSFETVVLLGTAAFIILMFSLGSAKQLGLRMLLPAAPLVSLWVATTLVRYCNTARARNALIVLTAGIPLTSAVQRPDYLAYFNPLIGKTDPWRIATDSNLDWGQDLRELNDYLDRNQIRDIQLVYYGRVPPEIYGIRYTVPKKDSVTPGLFAISVSWYSGSYFLPDNGRFFPSESWPPNPAWGKPIARIGGTIDLYDVPRTDAR